VTDDAARIRRQRPARVVEAPAERLSPRGKSRSSALLVPHGAGERHRILAVGHVVQGNGMKSGELRDEAGHRALTRLGRGKGMREKRARHLLGHGAAGDLVDVNEPGGDAVPRREAMIRECPGEGRAILRLAADHVRCRRRGHGMNVSTG
jgi:hypothetical protein